MYCGWLGGDLRAFDRVATPHAGQALNASLDGPSGPVLHQKTVRLNHGAG